MERNKNSGALSSICLSVILSFMSPGLVAKPIETSKATLADAGVINKDQILYWLINRR